MKPARATLIAINAFAFQSIALADQAPSDKLNDYLVDISGGAVSAGGLVGLDKGISQIETSQDIILALQPLTSGDSKSAFGLAITPARTTLTPMSGSSYIGSNLYRLLGSVTLSYAQNKITASGADYQTRAYSIGTSYYFSLADDPIAIGNEAFGSCLSADAKAQNASDIDAVVKNGDLTREGKQTALTALTEALNRSLSQCIDETLKKKTRWNASKASLSYGDARISTPTFGELSLARAVTLNVQAGVGSSTLIAASLRSVRKGLEVESLGTPTPTFKNTSLAAVRFAYGDSDSTKWRAIAEASNVKSSSPAVFKQTFLYALGLDKKIANGMWLELRIGRNRSIEDGTAQTTALANVNIAPSLLSFKQ